MELTGEQKIAVSRETVFAASSDPEILKQCIPGCRTLNRSSDTETDAEVGLRIGPVKATFKGAVTLSKLNPPGSYTITGEGKGGAAGFAKGGDGTILKYAVKAQLGGKIARLGSRPVDSTARKLSGRFFEKFAELVGPGERRTGRRRARRRSRNVRASPGSGSIVSLPHLHLGRCGNRRLGRVASGSLDPGCAAGPRPRHAPALSPLRPPSALRAIREGALQKSRDPKIPASGCPAGGAC